MRKLSLVLGVMGLMLIACKKETKEPVKQTVSTQSSNDDPEVITIEVHEVADDQHDYANLPHDDRPVKGESTDVDGSFGHAFKPGTPAILNDGSADVNTFSAKN